MTHLTREVKWEYEDQLPESITDDEFHGMYDASEVIYGVRMYPYIEIEINGEATKIYLEQ